MPVDFEPLYSASPPLFKHFGGGPAFVDLHFSSAFSSSLNHRRLRPPAPTCAAAPRNMSYPLPLRSCLIVRSTDVAVTTSTNGYGNGHRRSSEFAVDDLAEVEDDAEALSPPTSPTRTTSAKKKVVFADDRGYALTTVKLMTEASDMPPRWRDEFVERVTHGAALGDAAASAPPHWEPMFAQPASNYVDFRQRLERDGVCLENVIARDVERQLVGTVKVKNLHFSKEVLVRASVDRWATHVDHPASYVPSGSEGTSVYDLYDTFSFSLPLPATTSGSSAAVLPPPPLEFCVLFRCEGREHWDNNGGVNYVLRASLPARASPHSLLPKFEDAFTARIDSWTEFASWNHLVNDAPYW